MESPSNLRSLSQSLALKKAQDANEVASVTNAELQRLGNDLQRQSSAVLTTTALSITQSAAKEMQSFEQQITPVLDKVSQDVTQRLEQFEDQIIPVLETMSQDVNARLLQMQEQISRQLKPLNESQMNARLEKLQTQIDAQTGPLVTALEKIKNESEALSLMTSKSWLKPVLISLCALLSISLPVWGLTQYLADQVQSNLALIAQQTQTLQQLQAQTWGVSMHADSGGRFLVLPEGSRTEAGYKVGKRPAIKLLEK